MKNDYVNGYSNGHVSPHLKALEKSYPEVVREKSGLRWDWDSFTPVWELNAPIEWLVSDVLVQDALTLITGRAPLSAARS